MKYHVVPVTHYQQNCSVIWCTATNKAAVIDPGGDIDRIASTIDSLGVEVEKILLTHGHMDHVGGVAKLSKQLGVPIEGPHKDDLFWIEILDQQADMMGFEKVDTFTPARWLQHNDAVYVGECELKVLHCPGHTPGHVVFYHEPTEKAFVGDVIFKGSVGRTDFPRGNQQQLVESIRERLFSLADSTTFVPGHGPESSIGIERIHNPFVADHRFG